MPVSRQSPFELLLQRLAAEHEREVRELRAQIGRLSGTEAENEVFVHRSHVGHDMKMARPSDLRTTTPKIPGPMSDQNKDLDFCVAADEDSAPEPDGIRIMRTSQPAAWVESSKHEEWRPFDRLPEKLEQFDGCPPPDDDPKESLPKNGPREEQLNIRMVPSETRKGILKSYKSGASLRATVSSLEEQPARAVAFSSPLERWGALIHYRMHVYDCLAELDRVWQRGLASTAPQDTVVSGSKLLSEKIMGVKRNRWVLSTFNSFRNSRMGMITDSRTPELGGPAAPKDRSSKVANIHSFLSPLPQRCIVHPNSRWRLCWDIIGSALLTHDLIMIPMSAFNSGTNGMPQTYKDFEDILNVVATLFWTGDMIVSFLTGYYSTEGFIEMRPTRIASHYIKSWFSLDLLIVVVDWTSLAIGLGSTSNYMRLGKTVSRFMRVLRLLRFIKMSNVLQEKIERINSEFILTVAGLVKIVFLIVIFNHYIACTWYGLSQVSLDDRTWAVKAFDDRHIHTIGYAYATSMHWSLTQFTPASMEVTPENVYERIFNVIVIIVALVVFSSFVSSITNAMTHIRNINARKTEQETAIRRYFNEHKISHQLAGRVWHFLRRNRITTMKRIKEEDIPCLKLLPNLVRQELRQEVYMPILGLHPLFNAYAQLDPVTIGKICNEVVSERTMIPGEELVSDPKAVNKMTFVVAGSLEYHHDEDTITPLLLKPGQWCCEIALWATRACLSGPLLAAISGCEVVLVSAECFREAVQMHPDMLSFVSRYADLFINQFNHCLQDENDQNIMFNSCETIQEMVHQSLCDFQYDGRRTFGRDAILRHLFTSISTRKPSASIEITDGLSSAESRSVALYQTYNR